ncbi:MAG: MATE family efflux transporter [Ignavibacteriales bacterium]|nr:MATE family efflux transporter [Ignavibacteriales bacterium]
MLDAKTMSAVKSGIATNLLKRLLRGDERTVRTKKNILGLFLLRGMSQAIGLILVPLTLHYLEPTKYGIWLTLSSIVGWFVFFDIGLGNGFRNKFAEALARNNVELARVYVSTTFVMLGAIVSVFFLLFLAVNPFLGWAVIFNTSEYLSGELSSVVTITFSFFCLRFVFGLIGTVLIADQKPALNSLLDLLGNVASLIIIWLLMFSTQGSLLNLSIGLGASTALIPLGASLVLFSTKYSVVRPSWRYVQFSHARELASLGVKFFILQVSSVIIFSSANILIAQLYSPADVVPYNIAFKYYNTISMFAYLFLLPFWSAYTEAFTRGDIAWIEKTIQIQKRIWYIVAGIVVIMSLLADTFYRLWVGSSIHISAGISISMAIYVLIVFWCNIYGNLINGTGKIHLEVIFAVLAGVVNIPLTIFLCQYLQFGVAGVIIAPSICLLPACFLWPMQVKKILSGNPTGIWAK